MPMLPDPDTLLAVADRIARHAAVLRRHADVLGASVGHATWHGTAARSFALEALEVCATLRRSADRLDAAANALRRHAARVRAVLHDLAHAATAVLMTTEAATGAAVGATVDIARATGQAGERVLDSVGLG